MATDREPIQQLSELFGNYKAEYLRERIFDLYTQPNYFPELETGRPCVLVGGRGTGKTTVLRSLSYEGRFALAKNDPSAISEWNYFGFYLRVDTNRVTAFRGSDLEPETWSRLFAHYINLLFCGQVLKFLSWYARQLPDNDTLSPNTCRLIALSLRLNPSSSHMQLLSELNEARIRFEAFLNNLDEDNLPPITLQAAPVDELLEAVAQLSQFAGRHFFFLIDEYENFLDEQQVVLNTFIKHSGTNYTFKVGVRELGWRVRHTVNPTERLTSPADFALISIADKLSGSRFDSFASNIINRRMESLDLPLGTDIPRIQDILPGLTEDEEAKCLGVEEILREKLRNVDLTKDALNELQRMPPLEAFFIVTWDGAKKPIAEVLANRRRSPVEWKTRFGNYKHSALFTIREGKRGIRKSYAGWDTFLLLAASNIRYLIELVDQTLIAHANNGGVLGAPVSWEVQTRAAEGVGRKNVSELEGLSVHGGQLTKLVLGLGRIFNTMARFPHSHAPEINQFHLPDVGELPSEVSALLTAGVMHLALVRTTGSKLARDELKDYDYSLHPIFAPFFVFSYRKKRKMTISPERLMGLVRFPNSTINDILGAHNRSADIELPEQLLLFESYYGSDS